MTTPSVGENPSSWTRSSFSVCSRSTTLNGVLYVDRMLSRSYMTAEAYLERWWSKPLEECKARLGGRPVEYEAVGWPARILQHAEAEGPLLTGPSPSQAPDGTVTA